MHTSKNPYYTNSSLIPIEHRIVDVTCFQDFVDLTNAFYGEDNTKTGDIIVSSALFKSVVTDHSYASHFDPVCKFENVERGYIGAIHGHHIFTDTYMDQNDPERIFADGGERPQMILLQQVIATDE